jgi:hypothetical protein
MEFVSECGGVQRVLTGNDALHESYDAFKENGECLPNTGEDSGEARADAPEQTGYSSVHSSFTYPHQR